jgi:thiamine biosynthesis lipoprotein
VKKIIILLIAFAGSLLFSCRESARYIRHEGFTQGTYYRVTYEIPKGIDVDTFRTYEKEIVQLLHDFSASLSIYDPSSLISHINRNDPAATVDDYFRTVFNKSAEVHKASDGVFDITIAPIVNLWGFGFTSDSPEMNPEKIDSLLQYVGMPKIRIEGDTVVKDLPGVMLDVNAIAKGYSVDVVADFLKKKGCRNYLVDIGGECLAQGVNTSGDIWRVGVERPAEHAAYGEDYQAIVRLNNRSMATSGNYRRFFEIDGVKYAHTIDVKTGYPVRHNLLSATVIADDCMTADAWATVCMASGLDKSIEILQQHPEFEALLIYSDEKGNYKAYATKGLDAITVQ